eukprot:3089572-Rhodomonas_salina.2
MRRTEVLVHAVLGTQGIAFVFACNVADGVMGTGYVSSGSTRRMIGIVPAARRGATLDANRCGAPSRSADSLRVCEMVTRQVILKASRPATGHVTSTAPAPNRARLLGGSA